MLSKELQLTDIELQQRVKDYSKDCLKEYIEQSDLFRANLLNTVTEKAFTDGYKEGSGYQWHSIQSNPKDLPQEDVTKDYLVAFAYNSVKNTYYAFDIATFIEGHFITNSSDATGRNNGYRVLAWSEIKATA